MLRVIRRQLLVPRHLVTRPDLPGRPVIHGFPPGSLRPDNRLLNEIKQIPLDVIREIFPALRENALYTITPGLNAQGTPATEVPCNMNATEN